MASADDLRGLEFDWLAVDAEGAVALLSTAGGGYAPRQLVETPEDYNRAIDAILKWPVRTLARCAPELRPDLTNTWKLVAQRGLFAFDSDPLGGPYRIVAVPEEPTHLSQLPETVAAVARRIVYGHLHFARCAELTAAQLRQ
jgi:hypothetical protein